MLGDPLDADERDARARHRAQPTAASRPRSSSPATTRDQAVAALVPLSGSVAAASLGAAADHLISKVTQAATAAS